jgi:hypothetical protein
MSARCHRGDTCLRRSGSRNGRIENPTCPDSRVDRKVTAVDQRIKSRVPDLAASRSQRRTSQNMYH